MRELRILLRRATAPPRPVLAQWTPQRPMPREMRFPAAVPDQPQVPETVLRGRCWVIDGDTIVIGNRHIRLAGIDAPELDHPWGKQSKWALVRLCQGQEVTAHLKPEMSYDRVVAECFLPDGRDLAAEMVKAGLALDWPKFSGGKYRYLEPAEARRKLWRANIRQRGMMVPTDDVVAALRRPAPPPSGPRMVGASGSTTNAQVRKPAFHMGWLVAVGAFVMLVGCQFVGSGGRETEPSSSTRHQAASPAQFTVTAAALNVRAAPAGNATVLTQLVGGTTVTPTQMSGSWYGVTMEDGRTGWVHGNLLRQIAE